MVHQAAIMQSESTPQRSNQFAVWRGHPTGVLGNASVIHGGRVAVSNPAIGSQRLFRMPQISKDSSIHGGQTLVTRIIALRWQGWGTTRKRDDAEAMH